MDRSSMYSFCVPFVSSSTKGGIILSRGHAHNALTALLVRTRQMVASRPKSVCLTPSCCGDKLPRIPGTIRFDPAAASPRCELPASPQEQLDCTSAEHTHSTLFTSFTVSWNVSVKCH